MRGIIGLLRFCASILIGYVGKFFWSRRKIILIREPVNDVDQIDPA